MTTVILYRDGSPHTTYVDVRSDDDRRLKSIRRRLDRLHFLHPRAEWTLKVHGPSDPSKPVPMLKLGGTAGRWTGTCSHTEFKV